MDNAFRRALVLASINEGKTEEGILIDILGEHYPKYLKTLTEKTIIAIVQTSMLKPKDKKMLMDALIPKEKEIQPAGPVEKATIPDGKGGWKEVTIRW